MSELSLWKILLRGLFTLMAALVISYLANWLLDALHLDPLGIRELQW